jgi:hypothetical protein
MTPNPRACRHCKSPARRNPCWHWRNRPSFGKYAPCEIEDMDARRNAEVDRMNAVHRMQYVVTFITALAAFAGLAAF